MAHVPSVEDIYARDCAIMRLVAEGVDYREICTRLHYSSRYDKMVRQAFDRMGVPRDGLSDAGRRARAVAAAFRQGMID